MSRNPIGVLCVLFVVLQTAWVTTELGAQSSNGTTSIVIGTVSLDARNFQVYGANTSVNGIHTKSIELTFADLTSGQTLKVSSDGDKGVFFFVAKAGDIYQLTQVYYMAGVKGSHAGWSYVYATNGSFSIFFNATNGVNNLGHLSWYADKSLDKGKEFRVVPEGNFEAIRSYVKSAHPPGEWNALEWHEVSVLAQIPVVPKSSQLAQQQNESPSAPASAEQAGKAQVHADATSLEMRELSFDDIYPVFHTYYDTHPLGKVMLSNISGQPITGIKVSFQIRQFMDEPKDCPAPSKLGPGESKSVDLFGLFLPTILETTENTKAQARVDVEYTLAGQVQHQSLVQSIPILDRNATTWADDQRAAAFVTAKDPAVLTFSKNVNSMVKGKTQGSVNPNLLTAIAFFQALQLFGLTYSQDPIPTLTANKQVADYIQFPRQTLQYKGGKCSDFSVLYSALLESVGIETAFITIPGHIFIAFSAGVSPDEARKAFSHADDMIFRNEKSWIPVEVTESAGFLKAWQDGAKEWWENTSRNQAAFYPLHDAWQIYKPVGLPGAEVAVNLPPSEKIVSAYQEEAGKFIDQEIFPRVAALESQITKAQDPRKPTNELGVLYARYGQYDRAQKEFEKLLAKGEYVPALLNMGNILYLSDQKEKGLDYYNRAYAKDPVNPRVLLAVAKVNHDLENYFVARKVYAELKARDPDLALQFAYLDLRGEEATRAANAAGVNGVVVWEE